MKLNDLKKPLTANALNESLAKTFGTRIALDKFTVEQLEDARNKLRTQLSQVETSEKFESVHSSDTYQKAKMFLDVINQEMLERETQVDEAKPDFLDIDKDGDKKEPMKKAAKEKGDSKDSDSKGLSAKQKKLPAGLQKAIAGKKKTNEGAEEAATLVMAAKDMVDRVTGWMEDTAEMQTESMLELADSIRDEMGSEQSEAFTNSVKPALEALYTALEATREATISGVGILTGEAAPEAMGSEEEMPVDDADVDPMADVDVDAEVPAEDDGMAAAEPAVGGEEEAGRAKRESVERSRRIGSILSKKK